MHFTTVLENKILPSLHFSPLLSIRKSVSCVHFPLSYQMMLFLLFLSTLTISNGIVVDTSFGEIEGFEHLTPEGAPIQVFLGIRYGQAPDVFHRFKKAELVEKWSPIRHHARQFKAACIPFHEKALETDANFSEDCLFLNIMTPSVQTKDLPVFVFIHGGGYEVGSASSYGYKKLSNLIASQGIVVVTIQYRLGPFGFFSLGDQIAPGNIGLWDQTLALHFLHEILPSFGGDPSRITLSGHSTGSSSASALQFSPDSSSLFSQSFLMSGSSLSEFALSDSVVEESKKLAKELNCLFPDNSAKTITCLQEVSAHDIILAVDKIGSARKHSNFLKFHPLLDGEFFPHSIERLAKGASKKRTVTGFTDQESALFVLYEELEYLAGIVVPFHERHNFTRESLEKFITEVIVTDEEHTEDASSFRKLLVNFYIEKDEKKGDSHFYLQRFIELVSDLQFIIPSYQEVQIKERNDWPTWLYVIDHNAKIKERKDHPVKGAYHGDELRFFTDGGLVEGELNDEDKKVESLFTQAIVNFVKRGDPSTASLQWPPVTKENPFRHAVLRSKPVIRKEAFRADAAKLWLEQVPKVVSGEKLRRSRLPGSEAHIIHTEL